MSRAERKKSRNDRMDDSHNVIREKVPNRGSGGNRCKQSRQLHPLSHVGEAPACATAIVKDGRRCCASLCYDSADYTCRLKAGWPEDQWAH
jgi:hypothetical protein